MRPGVITLWTRRVGQWRMMSFFVMSTEARYIPSCEKARPATPRLCPGRTSLISPRSAVSYTRSSPVLFQSETPTTSSRPLGLKATAWAVGDAGVAADLDAEDVADLARLQVPDPHGRV